MLVALSKAALRVASFLAFRLRAKRTPAAANTPTPRSERPTARPMTAGEAEVPLSVAGELIADAIAVSFPVELVGEAMGPVDPAPEEPERVEAATEYWRWTLQAKNLNKEC
jgi:hypothetical protein